MIKKSKKLVYGVGINDADYVVQIRKTVGYENGKQIQSLIWICPFYSAWKDMLKRSYSEKFKQNSTTYSDVYVCKEWLTFSNFKAWMKSQPWKGMQLDKDLLSEGGIKYYSPSTCVFIPCFINTLLLDRKAYRGLYPLGVYYRKKHPCMVSEYSKPYVSMIGCKVSKRSKCLGYFSDPGEAHKAWQLAKADLIESTVESWQFDCEVNHTFRQDVAILLLDKASKLREYASNRKETVHFG